MKITKQARPRNIANKINGNILSLFLSAEYFGFKNLIRQSKATTSKTEIIKILTTWFISWKNN